MRWSPARPNLARVQPKTSPNSSPDPLCCVPRQPSFPAGGGALSRRRCRRTACTASVRSLFVSYSAVVGLIFLNKKEKKRASCSLFAREILIRNPSTPRIIAATSSPSLFRPKAAAADYMIAFIARCRRRSSPYRTSRDQKRRNRRTARAPTHPLIRSVTFPW